MACKFSSVWFGLSLTYLARLLLYIVHATRKTLFLEVLEYVSKNEGQSQSQSCPGYRKNITRGLISAKSIQLN